MTSKLFSGGNPFGDGLANASLQDSDLLDVLSSYKRRVASNYRAVLPDDMGTLPNDGLLVSNKIDGELWFMIAMQGEVFLANPRGRVITGKLPIFKGVAKLPDHTIIAGELHVQVDHGRCRVGDLSALIAQGKQADINRLRFAAFDILQTQDADKQSIYTERLESLQKLIKPSDQLFVIKSQQIDRVELAKRFEAEVMSGNSEGLIIRLANGLIYKLKPAITIDAAIIAFTPMEDQARSVLLGLMMPDETMQIFGGCGNLGTDAQRKSLLKQLSKLKIDAQIRYASDSGSLYTFVKPEVIVEIKVTDIQAEHSDGSVSKSMRLKLEKNQWEQQGMAACPRPIHAVIEKIREDKSANMTDIRFAQIEDYAVKDTAEKIAVDLPKSKVIRREVWTKETKGVTAVRKLVVWQTNKQEIDNNYPGYVVHWTDYSPGRASPLDREVKLAPNEKSAIAIADAMVEENIKKGWNKAQ
jgi:hypothetical protein